MDKVVKIATTIISVGVLGVVSSHAHADDLKDAQKQVELMDKQYSKLSKDKDELISKNKQYQKELLDTQGELKEQKKKIANFVQNVQASDFSQGYAKMLLASRGLGDLVTKIGIANNFAQVNQKNLKELQKTMQKMQNTSSENNATISNINREEISIKETLEAKKKLVSNILKTQEMKKNEVENVEIPKPVELVKAKEAEKVEVPKVADVLSEVSVDTPSTAGASSSSSSGTAGVPDSSVDNGSNNVAPVQPTIEFTKMDSDGVGFDGGQCTYGADALLGGDVPNWWGNAVDWFANAQAQGLPTGSTPAVGALIVYGSNVNIGGYMTGYQGHVGVVQSIQGSDVVVKEMNGTSGAWNYDVRTSSSTSGVRGYIYIR